MRVTFELHYQREQVSRSPDVLLVGPLLSTYTSAILLQEMTETGIQPVVVVGSSMRHSDPLYSGIYDPSEIINHPGVHGLKVVVMDGPDVDEAVSLVKVAGFECVEVAYD